MFGSALMFAACWGCALGDGAVQKEGKIRSAAAAEQGEEITRLFDYKPRALSSRLDSGTHSIICGTRIMLGSALLFAACGTRLRVVGMVPYRRKARSDR